MVVSVFVAMRNWLGVPWLGGAVCKWGAREVQSLIFQDENLRSRLNWCV
jgi:hypothetical protein